jgi:NADPH2:quinone reductase
MSDKSPHSRGARVIGVQRSSQPAGTDCIIDLQKESLEEAAKTLTQRRGADLVLDTVGGDLFEPALRTLRLGGRQIAIASSGKRRVEFDLIDFYHNAATLHGVDLSGFTGKHGAGILDELRAELENRALRALPIDETPLDRGVEAYAAVQRGTHKRQALILN